MSATPPLASIVVRSMDMAAAIAYRRRDYAAACALIERAVRGRGGDARLWYNYGLANAAASRVVEARDAFERVLALSPGHEGAAQWMAKLAGSPDPGAAATRSPSPTS